MAAEGSQRQDICEGCDFTEVTHFCETCPLYLCSRCTESHRRLKHTNDHTLKAVHDTGPNISNVQVLSHCTSHQNEPLQLYCDTCDDVLCIHCQQSLHTGHEVTPVGQCKSKMQNLCMKSLSVLFETTTLLKSDNEDVNSLRNEYIDGLRNVKTELLDRKQKLQTCIDETYNNSIAAVDIEISRKQEAFDSFTRQKLDSIDHAEKLDSKLLSVRRAEDVESLVGAFSEFKKIHPEIQKTANMKKSRLVTVTPDKMILPHEDRDKAMLTVEHILFAWTPRAGKPMLFHQTHGRNITLSSDKRKANRERHNYCGGICFGDQPTAINEKTYLKVNEICTSWSNKVVLGFTSHDPSTVDIPDDASDFSTKDGFWVKTLSRNYTPGSILYIQVTPQGCMMLGVDGNEEGVLLNGIKTTIPLWPIIDIQGKTSAMELVFP